MYIYLSRTSKPKGLVRPVFTSELLVFILGSFSLSIPSSLLCLAMNANLRRSLRCVVNII